MEFKNIYFYVPSFNVGGCELLFLRCANHLSSNLKIKISVIDYEGGYVSKCGKLNDNISIITKKKRIRIEDDTIVIIQTNHITDVRSFFKYDKDSVRFLFWTLHENNIHDQISINDYLLVPAFVRNEIGNSLWNLYLMQSLNFMGVSLFIDSTRDLGLKTQKIDRILPNLIDISDIDIPKTFKQIDKAKVIHFAWLGRLDDVNANTLMTYMRELEMFSIKHSIRLSVIGDGTAEKKLRLFAKMLSYSVVFAGRVTFSQLSNYIDDVHIGLASGTSAYEFCIRKIPVIIQWHLTQSYKAGVLANYHFLNESDRVIVTKHGYIREGQSTFSEKLQTLLLNYQEIAAKDFDYLIKEHTVDAVCNKILEISKNIILPEGKRQHVLIKNTSLLINIPKKVLLSNILRLNRIFGKLRG